MYLLHSNIIRDKDSVTLKIKSNWQDKPIIDREYEIEIQETDFGTDKLVIVFSPEEFINELNFILRRVGVQSKEEWEEVLKLRSQK